MLIALSLDGAQPLASRCPSSRISNVVTICDKGMVSNVLPENMAIYHFKGQQHHDWHGKEANTGFRVMIRHALRTPSLGGKSTKERPACTFLFSGICYFCNALDAKPPMFSCVITQIRYFYQYSKGLGYPYQRACFERFVHGALKISASIFYIFVA